MEQNQAKIIVDGGFKPDVVILKKNLPAQLTFIRTSDQGCLNYVSSTTLAFSAELPLNQPVTVNLQPLKSGNYDFSCGMEMFFGKVVVE
ncbi:cupredoxin domain-containing protein [Lactobacillus sp. ESL0681]|uniref:cupredoxin domain-containing protein n=1 Tax=Lactobacillus sp. ESL0681 TaxID=2983211 RepID=UPI0023F6BA65|nr:cupredoxin domain-containing protein [Lactobacillus sp. ESL0681]WEV39561.1 cupredoxin domain-containing protein [Lactobacillus sp. ESL0681]